MPRGTGSRDSALLQGRLWTPEQLRGNGLLAWYDAIDGRFGYGTGVSTWADKSGNGNSVTQATGGNQPILTRGYINGQAAVVFNGSSQFLQVASVTATQRWSAFAVFIPNSVTGVQSVVDRDDAGLHHSQTIRLNGTALESIEWNTALAAFTDASGMTAAIGAPILASAVMATNTIEVWGQGSSNGSTAVTGTPPSGTVKITLGRYTWQSQAFFNGGIGEVVMLNATASPQLRQTMEGYLAWKWWPGKDNTLPASHPFKNRPPLIGD